MSETVLELQPLRPETQLGRWMVVIFNNEHTMMDDVIEVLMRATGCDLQEAYIEMWEAHTFGKAPVHFSTRLDCEQAAGIIESVGIKTEVALEWPD